MIRAVIFDFGQTLVDSADGFRSAEKTAETKIFSDLNLASWEDFIFKYREARARFKGQSNFSRISLWKEIYLAFHRPICEETLLTWEDEYWDEVRKCSKPFPETEEVLTRLHSRFELALITNTQGQGARAVHRINDFPALEKFFKVILVAGESGIPPKPDPVPFCLCLEKLGVAKEEAVYVGDDWKIDIMGAMGAGIKPVWLKHHMVKRNWPEQSLPVPVITDLFPLIHPEQVTGI
jgi:HAD superfamily hydrolase (TIGR01549 family)